MLSKRCCIICIKCNTDNSAMTDWWQFREWLESTVISRLSLVTRLHICGEMSHQPSLTSDLWRMDWEQAGNSAKSDAKRWQQYVRVSKCHHGSSGGVTAGHIVGHRGLAVRARPRGWGEAAGGGGWDIWTLEPSLDYLYLFAPTHCIAKQRSTVWGGEDWKNIANRFWHLHFTQT